jgi:hypothetical protein
MTSMAQVNQAAQEKYNTLNNQYSDFPLGSRVEVIVGTRDFSFFHNEQGTIVENNGGYLGLIVQFDNKHGGRRFNFHPQDLILLEDDLSLVTPAPNDELSKLLAELEDAAICSYGDNLTQNLAAKKRAKTARIAIKQLFIHQRIDEYCNEMPHVRNKTSYRVDRAALDKRIDELNIMKAKITE